MKPLNTLVLTARPMTLGDVDALASWFDCIDDVLLFDRSAVVPASLEAIRESWKADLDPAAMPPKALWYIAEESSGRPAAIAGLRSINYLNGDALLAAFVSRHMRGRGVGVRLSAMVLDAGFTRMRLARVTSCYREDNAASAGILRSTGFCEEGRLRKALLANGRRHDLFVLGLLQEEWLARRDALNAELDDVTAVRFPGQGNEQYDWPRRERTDNLVRDLTARRERLEVAGRKGVRGP